MPKTRKPGRPSADTSPDVWHALLEAAENKLLHKQFRDITVRELAAEAGVNTAMISYYFNNKEGLFVALIEFLFSEWERRIQHILATMPTAIASPTADFVAAVDSCFFRHAPVIKLLTRELAASASPIQAAYNEKLASRVTAAITRYLQGAMAAGFYREVTDSKHATLLLAAISIHPIAIEPHALASAYHVTPAELRSEAWLKELALVIERAFGRQQEPGR
jgi:AcrR family transcriptional regulator